ncbi:MAG: hypothetical protein ACOCYZ_05135 [Halococcoides sp.]
MLATSALASPVTSSHTEDMVVNDFEGEFPGENALGEWSRAGDLDSSVVTEDSRTWLELSYDGAGWFASNVRRDLTGYTHLEVAIRGADGGEASDATIEVGGVEGALDDLAEGSIGTERSVLSVDLDAAGVDRSSVDDIWLEFFGATGTVWIDELRFVAGGPPALGKESPGDPNGDGVFEDVDGNGEVAFPDVNLFFQHSDSTAVTEHSEAFDFNDDGSISLQDVLALFRRV